MLSVSQNWRDRISRCMLSNVGWQGVWPRCNLQERSVTDAAIEMVSFDREDNFTNKWPGIAHDDREGLRSDSAPGIRRGVRWLLPLVIRAWLCNNGCTNLVWNDVPGAYRYCHSEMPICTFRFLRRWTNERHYANECTMPWLLSALCHLFFWVLL